MNSRLLIYVGPLVTLTVIPYAVVDTANIPKMFVLGIISMCMLGLILKEREYFIQIRFRYTLIFPILFIIGFLPAVLFSKSPLELQFFGAYGRNTGFLTYIFFVIVLIFAAANYSQQLLRSILKGLTVTSLIEVTYAYIQYFKDDPINWNSEINWIFGTLVNPNFLSAFLGISCVVLLAEIIMLPISCRRLTWNVLQIFATIFIILRSESVQGIAITMIGFVFIVLCRMRESENFSKLIPWSILAFILIALLSIFGMLQKGPLSSFLFQESITYRGDYWRAGLKMFLSRPFTGVGIDSYGDWYMHFRNLDSAARRGPDFVSNAAHNVFIDMAANGGILLISSFLVLNFYIFILIIKEFRNQFLGQFEFVAISAAWIAFTAQSIISINFIGVAIWGYMFSGLIIGRKMNSQLKSRGGTKPKFLGGYSRPRSLRFVIVYFALGLVLVGPILVGDIRWKSAIDSNNPLLLKESAQSWPRNSFRYEYSARYLAKMGNTRLARILVRESINFNSRSFDSWRLMSTLPDSTSTEKLRAVRRMHVLDPFDQLRSQ